MSAPGEITLILDRLRAGDPQAKEDLMCLVYADLRQIARGQLRHERANHTLQPTALVHESWIRLLGKSKINWENREHFFACAAHSMRRILVDHARGVHASKRGSGAIPAELSDVLGAVDSRIEQILAVDEAMERLSRLSPRQKTIVELRFFAGFSEEEIAEIMQLSARTIKREWATAKAWLYVEMAGSGAGEKKN